MNATPSMETQLRKRALTLKIALTAMFTALVTVATVTLGISLPAANGYFNLGEAMVYVAAMLLGPISGGIAGGAGAALGDLILGFPHYAPATVVIKFLEGLIVGFLFRQFKRATTEETLSSGRTTMRILQSGFLIGAAVIIVGVNADPVDTVLWVLVGSFFIGVAFLSIVFRQVPIYYMIIAMLAGGTVMVFGYLLYATFVLSAFLGDPNYLLAYLNLPWDTMQVLVGIVIAVPVYQALLKAGLVNLL